MITGFGKCAHFFITNTRNGFSRTHLIIGDCIPPPHDLLQVVNATIFHKNRRFRLYPVNIVGGVTCIDTASADFKVCREGGEFNDSEGIAVICGDSVSPDTAS